ncbi:hypothetical protein B9Z55_005639 [Caenorhabditis nigoni]|uniref:RNase H type-1 domain-containing protein n=3 Tax=Caenorhabditis nigoni TaxID=1611254 RepID=A0A2G5V1T3_9PELO|nr:hypothetical protein B9Z55_005639 [Caenorhabditis nigoni]
MRKRYPDGKNSDLFEKLCSVMPRFKTLIHWMFPKEKIAKGLMEAEHLAKLISGNHQRHVTIVGMGTADDGMGRYGIYWKPGDQKNGSGWIEGPHSRLCLEMAALEVAIKNGINQYVQHLTVYTDSEDLKEFITNWRHVWRDTSWPPQTSSVHSGCVRVCRDLTSMLDKITVEVRDGKEGYIDEARKLADSVQAFRTVRTFGTVQRGNNEDVGRYGLYWLLDQSEAEYGFVDGVPSDIRSKQTSIIRALQIALRKGFTKLVIQSDLIEKEGFDEKLEREIKILESRLEVSVTVAKFIHPRSNFTLPMVSRLMMQRFRLFSTIPAGNLFSEAELQAIVQLKHKAAQISTKSIEKVLKTRCWAKASVLEVSGRKPSASWQQISKKGQKFKDENEQAVVKLRWANYAERDVDILLSPIETLYTVEVKAVLYGIINAIAWNESKVRMKSSNEVVVKVANKRYSASKEAASFHLIRLVVNASDTKNRESQLKVAFLHPQIQIT